MKSQSPPRAAKHRELMAPVFVPSNLLGPCLLLAEAVQKSADAELSAELDLSDRSVLNDRTIGNTKPSRENARVGSFLHSLGRIMVPAPEFNELSESEILA